MKLIPLTQGLFAKVDDDLFDYLNQWKWSTTKCGYKHYAKRCIRIKDKEINIYMHRLILNASVQELIDHIDGDGHNNQRDNLRVCTKTQNGHNRGKPKNNTSGYKGVNFDRRKSKWRAVIIFKTQPVFLGHFDNKKDAALAYNEAAKKYFGEFAWINPV